MQNNSVRESERNLQEYNNGNENGRKNKVNEDGIFPFT